MLPDDLLDGDPTKRVITYLAVKQSSTRVTISGCGHIASLGFSFMNNLRLFGQ
jgi:hypothetical protein